MLLLVEFLENFLEYGTFQHYFSRNIFLRESGWLLGDGVTYFYPTTPVPPEAEKKARVIAASPYMLQTLQAVVDIIGEEDLPDNGELSGAAVSDMV